MECIYLLKNNKNGKVYVGKTRQFKERKYAHLANLRAKRHVNKMLQEDYNEYGEDAFIFEIAEETNSFFLNFEEQQWMLKLKTYDFKYGYNCKDPYFYSKQYDKPTKNLPCNY